MTSAAKGSTYSRALMMQRNRGRVTADIYAAVFFYYVYKQLIGLLHPVSGHVGKNKEG